MGEAVGKVQKDCADIVNRKPGQRKAEPKGQRAPKHRDGGRHENSHAHADQYSQGILLSQWPEIWRYGVIGIQISHHDQQQAAHQENIVEEANNKDAQRYDNDRQQLGGEQLQPSHAARQEDADGTELVLQSNDEGR